jgi:hypothetical protein
MTSLSTRAPNQTETGALSCAYGTPCLSIGFEDGCLRVWNVTPKQHPSGRDAITNPTQRVHEI